MLQSMKTETLRVPGARLSYDARGSGPLLLLIPGGEGGAEGYYNLADQLANEYTVVTYDRRGAPRSSVDDPNEKVRLETHSEDAHQLLTALTSEPAYAFGSSGGGLVGLDLTVRYPAQVRTLVAHEPPVEGLLPEFDRFQAEILATYQTAGGAAALMKFVRDLGVTYDDIEPGVELPPQGPRDLAGRGEALIAYTFRGVHAYRLDIAAVTAAGTPIVLAGGGGARESLVYRNTVILAERLGTSVVDFPGHHSGYVNYPRAFAARLREVLAGT